MRKTAECANLTLIDSWVKRTVVQKSIIVQESVEAYMTFSTDVNAN